jgi:hypothetical protein
LPAGFLHGEQSESIRFTHLGRSRNARQCKHRRQRRQLNTADRQSKNSKKNQEQKLKKDPIGRIGFLYEITAADPVTLLGTTGLIAIVALLAHVIPLRRAMKIDPIVALREE